MVVMLKRSRTTCLAWAARVSAPPVLRAAVDDLPADLRAGITVAESRDAAGCAAVH